jgi:hypothetical protein
MRAFSADEVERRFAGKLAGRLLRKPYVIESGVHHETSAC